MGRDSTSLLFCGQRVGKLGGGRDGLEKIEAGWSARCHGLTEAIVLMCVAVLASVSLKEDAVQSGSLIEV